MKIIKGRIKGKRKTFTNENPRLSYGAAVAQVQDKTPMPQRQQRDMEFKKDQNGMVI